MDRVLGFTLALVVLAAASPLRAQETQSLEASLKTVLTHGNLLDLDELSSALGLEISFPATDENGENFHGMGMHVPTTMYANNLSYTVRVNRDAAQTSVDLHFVPHICWYLKDWARDWHQQVQTRMATDAGGSSESILWDGEGHMGLTAMYSTNGGCSFDLQQTFDHVVLPRFTKSPPQLTETRFDQQIVELVKHGDLRDYRWTAQVLRVDLEMGRAGSGAGFFLNLGQVIPGVKSGSFSYVGNDSAWVAYPGSIYYLGKSWVDDPSIFPLHWTRRRYACRPRQSQRA